MPDENPPKIPFFDRVMEKANDLATLTIHTIVGEFSLSPDQGTLKATADTNNSEEMFTRIDLIDGDITTALNAKFMEDQYQEIRKLHMEREKNGKEIIQKNLETLEKIAETLVSIMNKKPSKPSGSSE